MITCNLLLYIIVYVCVSLSTDPEMKMLFPKDYQFDEVKQTNRLINISIIIINFE